MGYQAKFEGWSKLLLEDLIVAYRKAKADSFFESTFPSAIKFAEYEQDLLANLKELLTQLQSNKGFSDNDTLLGEYRVVPKKLGTEPKDAKKNSHIHFSKPERAFDNLLKKNQLVPEFRIIGDFPVETHIISALWINMVGHKFDACLDSTCYGARLKRVRNDDILANNSEKPFHITAIGSFVPYFQPYQKWRNDGLKAIRDELEKDRDIVAVSMDLKSYYHTLDPLAIASKALQKEIGLTDRKKLSVAEKKFTRELATLLDQWSKGAKVFSKNLIDSGAPAHGGLVIGLTSVRIISNVLLYRWDKLIKEKITPIHYGRYVDDMFLVLRDPGTIDNAKDLMNFMQGRLGKKYFFQVNNKKSGKLWQIQQGKNYQKKSVIQLQAGKQKLFILQGRAGLDLLDSIERDIYELSSEYRLMPSPDQLENSTAAKVLTAAGHVGEHADTLRRADGLTIQRLSWSLQLRHVETLARDLPANEWRTHRKEFYQFAHNHILRPDSLFSHFIYLPRLLGFAISLNEWAEAERIVRASFDAIDKLAEKVSNGDRIAINGKSCKADGDLWRYVKGTLTWIFIDAAAKYYDPYRLLAVERSTKESRIAKLFVEQILNELSSFEDLFQFQFGTEEFYTKAPLLAKADLARIPYKKILSSSRLSARALMQQNKKRKESKVRKAFERTELIDYKSIVSFLNSSRNRRLKKVKKGERKGESYLPYLFPTRAYTPAEVTELAPECVGLVGKSRKPEKPAVTWARYVRALRGVWVKPTLLAVEQVKPQQKEKRYNRNTLHIGTSLKKKVIVALTNLKTTDSDWAASASGKPQLTLDRYKRISKLVNQTIKLKPKPDYMLFPELSIPLAWVDSIAGRLNASGISFIAGTEYRKYVGKKIVSEACLVLTDNRLGFPASVKIWQPKLEPAVGEDKELTAKFGKTWYYSGINNRHKKVQKPVYNHNGFHFGVMVCSELCNTKARTRFQGYIDSLMVLAWNQDLDTFSSLIEAAALDLHAYTILVNNRKYGDSRVRSPAKESFMRDLAKVRGGDNDFVVAVTLDIDKLRAFQSRAKRWPEENDPFKPVPGGFEISNARKKLPPK